MGRKVREEEEEATLDMTPMLDVVFIMLIFFIVTTVFVKQSGMEVVKPEAKTARAFKNANIFIAITEDGEVWIDRQPVDVEAVRVSLEKLMAEQPTDAVFIQGAEKAKAGVVIEVMDQVRAAGVEKALLATRS